MSRNHPRQGFSGRRLIAGLIVTVAVTGTSVVMVSGPAAHAADSGPLSVGRSRAVAAARANASLPTLAPRGGSNWTQANETVGPSDSDLGASVAVSGNTMVVGAPFQDSAAGAAYLYTGSGTNWTEEAELTAPDGQSDDTFGSAVAIHKGIIAVGTECHSATAPQCEGATYVYTGSGATWALQTELDDPGAAMNDYFGGAVAVTSNAILVGATGENSNQGAVIVYTLKGRSWALKSEIDDPGEGCRPTTSSDSP